MKFPWFRRRQREEDLTAEIRSHLDEAIRERMARGETPEEARLNARREFGNVGLVKEVTRDVWRWRWLDRLAQDLRFGLRMIGRKPGFAFAAVGMLAIGIAANTTIFGIVEALILHPFDFPNQDRLVMIWSKHVKDRYDHKFILQGLFTDWRERNRSFEQLVGYGQGYSTFSENGQVDQVWGYKVSANFFDALGVHPLLGRAFQKGEDEPGREQVIILRHRFWQQRFAADPGIIGRTLSINGKPHTVIGVMPAGFNFPVKDGEFWLPLAFEETQQRVMSVFGLLKPGVSIPAATADLDAFWPQAEERSPGINRGHSTQVIGMAEDSVRDVKAYFPSLIGTVAFVLLIVCANVANLLYGRALGRQKEMAVRLALGASCRRLIGQMLTEGLLLALAGGLLGLLLSIWAIALLKGAMPARLANYIPGFEHLGINRNVLFFNLLLSMGTVLLFGLAPAWQSTRMNLNEALKEGLKGMSSIVPRGRIRSALVVAEIALSTVLLIGAGLLARSFIAMLRDDLGFNPQNVLSMELNLAGDKTAREQRRDFYYPLIERLRRIPGVTAVGAAYPLPMMDQMQIPFQVPGQEQSGALPFVDYRVVTPGYFDAIGLPIRRGRAFTFSDGVTAPAVVIVNEALARRFFPGQEALGQRFKMQSPVQIIGIVGDTRDNDLDQIARPCLYVPYAQDPLPFMGVAMRSTIDSAALMAAVREEVRQLNPAQPIQLFKTVEERIHEKNAPKRIITGMMTVFAGIAFFLAAMGLYAVMAYAVSSRTHEFGIRLALGAPRHRILQMVLSQGLKYSFIGLTLGLIGGIALSRVMASLLYRISPTDVVTFVLVSGALTTAALLACLLPARRATRVNPMIALRCE